MSKLKFDMISWLNLVGEFFDWFISSSKTGFFFYIAGMLFVPIGLGLSNVKVTLSKYACVDGLCKLNGGMMKYSVFIAQSLCHIFYSKFHSTQNSHALSLSQSLTCQHHHRYLLGLIVAVLLFTAFFHSSLSLVFPIIPCVFILVMFVTFDKEFSDGLPLLLFPSAIEFVFHHTIH